MQPSERSKQSEAIQLDERGTRVKMTKKGKADRAAPAITLHNRQRSICIDLAALQAFASRALVACLELPGKNASVLANLDELSVIIVSDRRMAELHHRFLHVRGPTDVITFQHGEIFVSAETAGNHARRLGNSLQDEIRLYVAHGLLHLHGFDDKKPADAGKMKRTQEKLVAAVLRWMDGAVG